MDIVTPLVSVVIPTYNRAAFLVEALESVLAQTWKNLEILVVDDGSTDNTRDALLEYRRRIKYIFQANSGVPSSPRNGGIQNATGEYIAMLDSDDIMFAPKLQAQVRFLEKHPDVAMVFSDFSTLTNDGTVRNSFTSSGHTLFLQLPKVQVGPNEYVLRRGVCDCLALDNFIGTSSVVARKNVFECVGLFDESPEIRSSEDIDMWFRIAEKFRVGYIDSPLHSYRRHDDNISSMNENVLRASIAVHKRFLKSGAISANTGRHLTRRLGRMYFSLGYLQLNKGKAAEAMLSLWESVKRRPVQLVVYKLFCASILPAGARRRLRGTLRALLRKVRLL